MHQVLEALSQNKIKVDDLITSRIELQDVVKNGLEVLKNDASQVKILVDMAKSVEQWEKKE